MANGVQFAGEISQSAAEVIYTPGSAVVGVATVSICNRGSQSVKVRLGYSGSATTSAAYYLEYGYNLQAGGVLERTGIVVSGTQTLIAECETASSVHVVVWSIEDTV